MAIPLLKIIPPTIAKYLHLPMGVIVLPLGTMLGTDSYFYGLLPLCIEIGENYGVTSLNMAVAMLIGKNLSLLVSPLVPATYLGIGLASVELKEHVKYSIPPLWIVSINYVNFCYYNRIRFFIIYNKYLKYITSNKFRTFFKILKKVFSYNYFI